MRRRSARAAPRSKILIKSAWGSADPSQASFAFHHANAFAEAGHEVQIFLLGEAVTLMRTAVASSVVPVGWPPLAEALAKVLEHKIPVHV
jgi:predicted peroxiredoxin